MQKNQLKALTLKVFNFKLRTVKNCMDKVMNELKQWIEANGGLIKFAQSHNLRYQSVQGWFKKGYVPPDRMNFVAKQTGIEARKLNPACFPN